MSNKNDELTVADAMQVVVKTVPSSMSLPTLENEMLGAQVSGFPVVDDNKLVGVVSRSDIVRQLCVERNVAQHTSDFYFDEKNFLEVEMESFKDIADRVGERIEALTVQEVMVKNPLTTRLDQPISKAARQFIDHHVHRLPVTDRGTLVGIITTTDLVRLIAERRTAVGHAQIGHD